MELQTSLPGFSHVSRYWDHSCERVVAKILPGQYYVTLSNEAITTVLGSCVSACIRDPEAGVGGMNHFMLPIKQHHVPSEAMRYGNWAMEHLINTVLKYGGLRDRLEIKIFGGSSSIELAQTDIGQKNIDFVRDYLKTELLHAAAVDLGGFEPRKIVYYPDSGVVFMKKLTHVNYAAITRRERDYMREITQKKLGGDIELF